MPRGPITSRPLIKDTDPHYSANKRRHYHAHSDAYKQKAKAYYEMHKERIKARKKQKYREKKLELERAQLITLANSEDSNEISI